MASRDFEDLVAAAERAAFSGWDFSYLGNRTHEEQPPWDYADLIRRRLPAVDAVLDLGTGGGEFLSSLAPLPPRTVATESYPPNVPIAHPRLAPLGVTVVATSGAPDNVDIAAGAGVGSLPFPDRSFPLVIDRHESYYPAEILRILRPGGRLITQQVGGEHGTDLNRLLGAVPGYDARWNLEFAAAQLEAVGLHIVERQEAYPEMVFLNVGAVVYYLKAIPWRIPDFTVGRYRERLAALHEHIAVEGGLRIRAHYFCLEAVKPELERG